MESKKDLLVAQLTRPEIGKVHYWSIWVLPFHIYTTIRLSTNNFFRYEKQWLASMGSEKSHVFLIQCVYIRYPHLNKRIFKQVNWYFILPLRASALARPTLKIYG